MNHKHLCEWREDESNLEDVKKKTVNTALPLVSWTFLYRLIRLAVRYQHSCRSHLGRKADGDRLQEWVHRESGECCRDPQGGEAEPPAVGWNSDPQLSGERQRSEHPRSVYQSEESNFNVVVSEILRSIHNLVIRIQVYYVRLDKDGTPEGNLSFTLTKQTPCSILGETVINDGQNINVLVLCETFALFRYVDETWYEIGF